MYYLKIDVADEDSLSQDVFAGLLIAAHVNMVLAMIANAPLSVMKGIWEVRLLKCRLKNLDPRRRERTILELSRRMKTTPVSITPIQYLQDANKPTLPSFSCLILGVSFTRSLQKTWMADVGV